MELHALPDDVEAGDTVEMGGPRSPDEAGVPGHRILVLNRNWQAVNIVGVKRAFTLLFQDHAKVIHSDTGAFAILNCEEWFEFSEKNPPRDERDCICTVRMKIRIPRILVLNEFDRLPVKEVKFTRDNIFERDNYTCQYCGRSFKARELNLDHVIPRERGGRTSWENIATSCIHCNTRKANRLPHEAGMHLIRKPQRPGWRPFVTFALNGEIDETWTNFLHVSNSAP